MHAHYRRSIVSVPLWAAGKKTVKQPIFINDLIDGLMAAMKDESTKGKIYQAVG